MPQWEAVSEVALLRAANGHLVAAAGPIRRPGCNRETIDHTEGFGISISTDDGRTWSEVGSSTTGAGIILRWFCCRAVRS